MGNIKGPFGVDVTKVHSNKDYELFEEVEIDGTVYAFHQANGALTQSQFSAITDNGKAVKASTTTVGSQPIRCGIPIATLADGEYGWFAVGPINSAAGVKVSALASCAADVKVYTTATAGSVDDTATTLISGLALADANGGATANVTVYAVKRLTCST